jgi:NADH:ubiquinone oxidoreductase subunit K
MKLLSPANKRKGKTAIFFFGLIVLGAMVVRIFRSGVNSASSAAVAVKDELKNLTSLQIFLAVVGLGFAAISYYLDSASGYVMAVALGTLTTGSAVVTTFNTTYLPKWVFYSAATQLTGLKITVQGDGVIFDSDAAGLNAAGVSRVQGQVTNGFMITLSNGFIAGKNVIWEFTNSAAQTPTVYVSSDETPANPLYLQLLRQAVLANSGQNFTDFSTITFPSLGATDIVNVLYNDGTQQQLNRADIQAQLAYLQNIVNTPVYMIDNFAGRIKTVNVIAGAAQTAYVQRWVGARSGGMVNQSVNN